MKNNSSLIPLVTEENPPVVPMKYGGPFLIGFIVNVVFGYTLYFVVGSLHEPPTWAISFIEHLKPTFKALNVAARLNNHPFPAQVMILYAAISAVPLTLYFLYLTFFVKKYRQEFYKGFCESVQKLGGFTAKQRLKIAANGIFIMAVSIAMFPMLLFPEDPHSISRVAAGFLSNSVFSVGLLLLTTGMVALLFIASLGSIFAMAFNLLINGQGANHG